MSYLKSVIFAAVDLGMVTTMDEKLERLARFRAEVCPQGTGLGACELELDGTGFRKWPGMDTKLSRNSCTPSFWDAVSTFKTARKKGYDPGAQTGIVRTAGCARAAKRAATAWEKENAEEAAAAVAVSIAAGGLVPKRRGRPPKKQAEAGETGPMVKNASPGKRQTIEADVEMKYRT